MQRAGNQRPVSARAIPAVRPECGPAAVAVADEPIGEELQPKPSANRGIRPEEPDEHVANQRVLEEAISQRIETRLRGRVRNLQVRVVGDAVILEGQCATYYTKQLAQHAAMGILNDEQLENAIVVSVP